MAWNPGPLLRCFAALLICSVSTGETAPPAESPQASLILTRGHPDRYQPGDAVEIVVTINGWGIENVRALGLQETVPEDWTLLAVQAYGDTLPDIYPEPGARPPFEFVWISPPPLPCVFSYTALVPESSRREKELSGVLLYHLNAGPLQTPPTVTYISGPEPESPEIRLRGDNPMEVPKDTDWVDPGYTALDYDNQDITGQVTVTGTVDTGTPGVYALEYRVTSASTTLSATVTRTVRVVGDSTQDSKEARLNNGPPFQPDAVSQPEASRTTPPYRRRLDENRPSETTPASPSPQTFPDLSSYHPLPLERPDSPKSTNEENDEPENPVKPEGKEPGETAVAGAVGDSNLTHEMERATAFQQEGRDRMRHVPGTKKAARLPWIAGIIALLLLLAGAVLVRHAMSRHLALRKKRNRF